MGQMRGAGSILRDVKSDAWALLRLLLCFSTKGIDNAIEHELGVAVLYIADVIGDTGTIADCVRAKVRFCIAGSTVGPLTRLGDIQGP
jgi:hypothetical protein